MSPKPHVEIAAIIPDGQGRIVIGKRKGKDGGAGRANDKKSNQGTIYCEGEMSRSLTLTFLCDIALYELPGGNLDFGEEIFACVERETLEETGLKVRGKKVIAYTNDIQKAESKHEVTLYVLCEREDASQQPEVFAETLSIQRGKASCT